MHPALRASSACLLWLCLATGCTERDASAVPVRRLEIVDLRVDEAGAVTSVRLPGLGGGGSRLELAGSWASSEDELLPAGLWTATITRDQTELSITRVASTTRALGATARGPHNGLRWQTGLPDGDLLVGTLHTDEPFTRPARTVWTNLVASVAPGGAGFSVQRLSAGTGPHWVGNGELVQDGDSAQWLGVAAASASTGQGQGRGAVLVSLTADPDGRWTRSSRPLLAPEEGWLKDWAISVVTRRAYLAVVTPRSSGVDVHSSADRLLAVALDDASIHEVDLDLADLGIRALTLSPEGDQLAVARLWEPDVDTADRPEPWESPGGGVLLLDLRSGVRRSLSRSGSWGRWRPGGSEVAALADDSRTLRLLEVETPAGRWLVRIQQPGETGAEVDEVRLWEPCWSPDGSRLAVSVSDGRWGTDSPTLVLDLATRTFVLVTTRGGLFAWTSGAP